VTIQMEMEELNIPLTVYGDHWRWQDSEELMESDFPLITEADSKRYELSSDKMFA